MKKTFKNLAIIMIMSFLISNSLSVTAFASTDKRLNAGKSNGNDLFITVSNVVEEKKINWSFNYGELTTYVADGPVTVKFDGGSYNNEYIGYFADAKFQDGNFDHGESYDAIYFDLYKYVIYGREDNKETVLDSLPGDYVKNYKEVYGFAAGNYATLTKPGYYLVTSFDSSTIEHTFIIQVTGEMVEKPIETKTEIKSDRMSRALYFINSKEAIPIQRFEDKSFPLTPEFTVAIDGEVVKYGKYKPVWDLMSGYPGIPLLQTLKAAGVTYKKEGSFYIFSNNNLTYKVAFDGSMDMEIIKDGKIVNTFDTGAYDGWIFDNEIFVGPRVLQIIFFHPKESTEAEDNSLISVSTTTDKGNISETMTQKEYNIRYNPIEYDSMSYYESARVLNLFSNIDPNKEIAKANEALRKVIDTIPPEYFLDIREMPDSEKEVLKSKAMEITTGITDNYEKAKAIHRWVAKYLAYDKDVAKNNWAYIKLKPILGLSDAFRTFELAEGVCSSYAELENQLLKSIGIPARIVDGIVGELHVWVDVFVDNKWISTDPTFDTEDCIVNGVRVTNYQNKPKNFENTKYFDFAFSSRSGGSLYSYTEANSGMGEDFDNTIYVKWFYNSPYGSEYAPPNYSSEEGLVITDDVKVKPDTATKISVFVGLKQVDFTADPFIENGTTLVPFRAIFESLGLRVTWDGPTQTVTGEKEGLTIKLVIGSSTATVNGETKTLLLAPRIVSGSTFVPLRFVGEASGKEVKWDGPTKTIKISE